MLTDVSLKNLKSKRKVYKVADRDGMYVAVAPSGQITFRYDYRLNGRRETLTIGRYGRDGLSLAAARERCGAARKLVAEGRSPAQEKQREKRRLSVAQTFGAVGKRWFKEARMAESTRAMRKAIFDRDILPAWNNRLLTEITSDDLRALCGKVKDRGAPATAIHVRDIVKQIYAFAILHGEKVDNPADNVGPTSIATFAPKDRALSPSEIRIMLHQLEHVPTLPTIRLGLRSDPAHHGAQERAARCSLGRSRFRECGLEHPKGADEARQAAQRLPVAAVTRHHDRAQDVRGELAIPAAVTL